MSGPFDINGLGANYFNSVQSGLTFSASSATYTPAFTSAATNISASLAQMCNLDVPSGKTRVLLAATISALDGTSNLLEAEIEVDGVIVLSGSAPSFTAGTAYIFGYSISGSIPAALASSLQINRNLKIRAKKPLSTTAILTLWYIDRA